jgi:hypothetical protein
MLCILEHMKLSKRWQVATSETENTILSLLVSNAGQGYGQSLIIFSIQWSGRDHCQ